MFLIWAGSITWAAGLLGQLNQRCSSGAGAGVSVGCTPALTLCSADWQHRPDGMPGSIQFSLCFALLRQSQASAEPAACGHSPCSIAEQGPELPHRPGQLTWSSLTSTSMQVPCTPDGRLRRKGHNSSSCWQTELPAATPHTPMLQTLNPCVAVCRSSGHLMAGSPRKRLSVDGSASSAAADAAARGLLWLVRPPSESAGVVCMTAGLWPAPDGSAGESLLHGPRGKLSLKPHVQASLVWQPSHRHFPGSTVVGVLWGCSWL